MMSSKLIHQLTLAGFKCNSKVSKRIKKNLLMKCHLNSITFQGFVYNKNDHKNSHENYNKSRNQVLSMKRML